MKPEGGLPEVIRLRDARGGRPENAAGIGAFWYEPEVWTLPLSPADYARTAASGALYGAAPHGLSGSLRPGWRVGGLENLRQVGGTVHPGGGVPLSLLSGWNGAGELLGLPYDPLGGPEFGSGTETA